MNNSLHVQLVGRDGSTLAERPVNLEDLLSRKSQSVEIGDGVRVVVDKAGGIMNREELEVINDIVLANEAGKKAAAAAEPERASKVVASEWSAVAPPSDHRVDYSKIEPLDITPPAKKFQPIPLAFHSMISYTDGISANKMLVYGGRNAKGDEQQEVYEFTLATGSWRRVETRQPQCNGVFAHASTVDGMRMYVLGGFGLGGTPIAKTSLQGHLEQKRYELLATEFKRLPSPPHTFGILPLLQKLSLSRFAWKQIPLGHPLHLAAHTVVCHKGILYVFGGVDERLQVSNNLIAIDPNTGEVRLLRRDGVAPRPRFLHSAVLYNDWMIVYGGSDANNDILSDAWAFNFATESWEEMPTVGAVERFGHACCVLGGRMLVMGGYGGWIDDEGAEPSKSFLELSLNPIKEQFLWKAITTKGSITNGVAFGEMVPCGSGTSFLHFGGLRLQSPQKPIDPDGSDDDDALSSSGVSSAASTPRGNKGLSRNKRQPQSGLIPCGTVMLMRFPDKPKRATSASRRETLSGDPNELSASMKTFLKRQDDFIVKRNFQAEQTERQRSLAIKESADANLYLKSEEVSEILESVDKTIDKLGSYDMIGMPDSVPDKAARIMHVDESKGLLRQARDVLKSMVPKNTAGSVKSKTHRKLDGAPEEHGGAKPFRRVIVMSLVNQVRKHMSDLNALTFGNYKWEQKEEYIAFANSCEQEVKHFISTMNRIRDSYIQHRLKSIEEHTKRRATVMDRLRSEVEKKRSGKEPIKTCYKGPIERNVVVTLEKTSITTWRESILTSIGGLQHLITVCEENAKTPYGEGVTFASQVNAAYGTALQKALEAKKQFELFQESVPLEANGEVISVCQTQFSKFEDAVNPLLKGFEGQIKLMGALSVNESPEGFTSSEKAGMAARDKFVKTLTKGVRDCRATLQTLAATFLSYVSPKAAKLTDRAPLSVKAVSNRTSSRAVAPLVCAPKERPTAVQEVTNVIPTNQSVRMRCEEEPQSSMVAPVAVLAEPLQTAFERHSVLSPVPVWQGPFSELQANIPVPTSSPPKSGFDDRTVGHFDFFEGFRASSSRIMDNRVNYQMAEGPSIVKNQAKEIPLMPPVQAMPAKVEVQGLAVVERPPAITEELSKPFCMGPSGMSGVLGPLSAYPSEVIPTKTLPTPSPAPEPGHVGATASLASALAQPPCPQDLPSVYSHAYASAQVSQQFRAPVTSAMPRPHTPADCPGTPFNPELSRDRGMFRGRLTPGERSILLSRQLNTMW